MGSIHNEDKYTVDGRNARRGFLAITLQNEGALRNSAELLRRVPASSSGGSGREFRTEGLEKPRILPRYGGCSWGEACLPPPTETDNVVNTYEAVRQLMNTFKVDGLTRALTRQL